MGYKLFWDRQFIIFLGVGLTAMAVQFFSFSIIWDLIHLSYKTAASFSYALSVTVHFLMNRTLTFKAANNGMPRQLMRYLIVVAINYSITMLVIEICVKGLSLSPYVGLAAAIGATVINGFVLLRFWVFVRN